jgi:hypothetical protein
LPDKLRRHSNTLDDVAIQTAARDQSPFRAAQNKYFDPRIEFELTIRKQSPQIFHLLGSILRTHR